MKIIMSCILIINAFLVLSKPCAEEILTESARRWKEMEEQNDIQAIRFSSDMRADTSKQFLTIPDELRDAADFTVATEAPTVEFGIIQGYKPWYLPISYQGEYRLRGYWEGYGDVTKGPDDCYYWSIGDHRSYNGNAYIFRYDPVTKSHKIVIDLKNIMGWKPEDFADGKIHGDLDFSPEGDTWFLSYFGPGPTDEEWDTVYKGSWLFNYNCYSGKTECLGLPLEGSSWPYYNFDHERDLFFGVAERDGVIIAYDTKEKRMIYGGACKKSISWHRRATMLDHDTGIFYSTDTVSYREGERYRGDHFLVSYERRNNTFKRMNSKVPQNPATGKASPLRAHTNRKDDSGAFWCFSQNGVMFKFNPDKDLVEYVGQNFSDGEYITNMAFSPKKRYIYYTSRENGTPLIQYDTRANSKKVIAFIHDYYVEKYGYAHGKYYGLELDSSGKSVFIYSNGGFTDKSGEMTYIRPSMLHIHIPESERRE